MADLRKINAALLPAVQHLLTVSEQQLLRQKQRGLQGLAQFMDGVCVGVVLFSDLPTMLRVERLFVFATYRRQGIGSFLLHTLEQLAYRGKKLLVVPFAAARQQDPVYQLIAKRRLAIVRQDSFEARVTREDAETFTAFYRRLVKRNPALVPAAQTALAVPAKQKLGIQTLTQTGTLPLVQQRPASLRTICDKIQASYPAAADSIRTGSYRQDLSFCYVHNGAIMAFCLMGEDAEGLCLQLLYTVSPQSLHAMLALSASMQAALADPTLSSVRMTVTSNSARQILQKLCPFYELTQHIYIAYSVRPPARPVSHTPPRTRSVRR